MDRVTICNMALEAFGQSPITSIVEAEIDSDEARLCFTFLDPCIRAVFEDAAPSFAVDLLDMGARQDSAYGLLTGGLLSAKFLTPTTLIRPLRCDDGRGDFTIKWQRATGAIVCEETETLLCEGVFYPPAMEDPNKWTPHAQFAVAYKLAYTICGPITHSSSVKREMLEEYGIALKSFKNLDGMAGTTNQQFQARGASSLASKRG